jgi:predicted dehydrogenase
MKTLPVGIIGCGGIARARHMPGYQRLEEVAIHAVADINAEAARQAADQFSVPHVFSDYRELLAMGEINAVSICTPNALHKEQTVAALRAGKHVLVEKPMAVNAAEAKAMVAAAKRADRKLMVGLHQRFTSGAQALKRAVDSGALGDIYFAEAAATRRRGIPGWGVFTQKNKSGGGALVDIGVHILDLALYLMGYPKPVSVSGVAAAKIGPRKDLAAVVGGWQWDPKNFDVEDFAVAFVRLRGGVSLVLKTCWAANIGTEEWNCSLWGTDGGCRLSPPAVFRQEFDSLVDITPAKLPEVVGHYEEIRLFVEAIRKDLPSPIPPEEPVTAQRILDAIYQSSRTGKEVRLT